MSRALRFISLTSLLIWVQGCGDASDPDAVVVAELKFPFGLEIRDDGGGTIQLSWRGSNSEDDFDGYNIYGVKGDADSLGVTEGEAIELLDADGEPVAAAKKTLQQFHYNKDEPFEPQTSLPEDDEKDFAFFPIHANADDDGDPLLPTCKTKGDTGTVSCTDTTEATEGQEGPGEGIFLNGKASYTITGLTAGQSYCFVILSSMDGGEDVSAVSSEVRCVVPRYKLTAKFYANEGLKFNNIDLNAIRTACGTECPDLTTDAPTSTATSGDYRVFSSTVQTAATDAHLQVEAYTTGTSVYFVNGNESAIQDLGYYEDGFDDPEFVKPPALTWDDATDAADMLQNLEGWNVPGQSIILRGKHIYAVAVTPEDGTVGESFYYDLVYITEADNPVEGTAFDVEIRLGTKLDAR